MRSFQVIAKPAGPACNLACEYCFYLEKESLYPGGPPCMDDETLERFVVQYLAAVRAPEVDFAWQGGEPTLLGTRFFERATALQRKHANGRGITNSLQTNGVLIDEEWGAFLAEHDFLVGVSIDGPARLHDAYRKDRAGRGTLDRALSGLRVLQDHGVRANTLTTVNAATAARPAEVYRFLKSVGSAYHQYIPVVERSNGGFRDFSVGGDAWGWFLTEVFDEWERSDVGRVFVTNFETALETWRTGGTGFCVHAETCGTALVLEANGDLYSCDHFVDPAHRLGNIAERTIAELAVAAAHRRFVEEKRDGLPERCLECEFLFACRGGCPKSRDRLCRGYRAFFRHARPILDRMASALRRGLPASAGLPRPGRNDPCRCGSGRKFKRCCG